MSVSSSLWRRPLGRAAMVLGGLLLPTVAAVAQTDPAGWVPSNALVYVGVDDVSDAKAKLEKTPVYKALNDPELKGQDVIGMVRKRLDEAAKELGFENAEALPWPEDALAFAVLPPKAAAEDPVVLVVVDSGKQAEKHLQILQKASEELVAKGAKRESEEFDDVKITIITPGEPKKPAGDEAELAVEPTASTEPLVYTQVAGKTLVASSVDGIKPAIRLVSGKAKDSLVTTDKYKLINKKLEPVGSLRLYVDISSLARWGLDHAKAKGNTEAEAEKVLTKLGLLGMKPLLGTYRIGYPVETGQSFEIFLPSGPQDDVVTALFGDNKPLPALLRSAGAQADSAGVVVSTLQINKLVDLVLDIAEMNQEGSKEMALQGMKAVPGPDGAPINMYDDVVQKLTGPTYFRMSVVKPFDAESLHMLLGLGTSDGKAVETTMKGLLSQVPFFVPRELLGQTIYDVQLPFPGLNIALAMTKDAVLLGTTPAVDQQIRTKEKAGELLTDAKTFATIAGKMPKDGITVFYQNDTLISEYLADQAKKADGGEANENMLLQLMTMASGGELDARALAAAAKYAEIKMGVFRKTDGGWQFIVNSIPAGDAPTRE